jgi:hypothetical protein
MSFGEQSSECVDSIEGSPVVDFFATFDTFSAAICLAVNKCLV